MEDDGKRSYGGKVEVALEELLLQMLGRMFVVVVEARFSNGAKLPFSGSGFEVGKVRFSKRCYIMRGCCAGVLDVRVTCSYLLTSTERFKVGANIEDVRNMGGFSAGKNPSKWGRSSEEVRWA